MEELVPRICVSQGCISSNPWDNLSPSRERKGTSLLNTRWVEIAPKGFMRGKQAPALISFMQISLRISHLSVTSERVFRRLWIPNRQSRIKHTSHFPVQRDGVQTCPLFYSAMPLVPLFKGVPPEFRQRGWCPDKSCYNDMVMSVESGT